MFAEKQNSAGLLHEIALNYFVLLRVISWIVLFLPGTDDSFPPAGRSNQNELSSCQTAITPDSIHANPVSCILMW